MDELDRELIAELYRPLRRFAAVVSPPEEDPDDLVQDVLVQTLRRMRLADLDAPLAYLGRPGRGAVQHRRHGASGRPLAGDLPGRPGHRVRPGRGHPSDGSVFTGDVVDGYWLLAVPADEPPDEVGLRAFDAAGLEVSAALVQTALAE